MTKRKKRSKKRPQPTKRNWLIPSIIGGGLLLLVVVSLSAAIGGWIAGIQQAVANRNALAALDANQRELLETTRASLANITYGFEPLLLDDESKIIFDNAGQAYLHYPEQPDNPAEWSALDCFAYSYAVRDALINSPLVEDVALGLSQLPSRLGEDVPTTASHVTAWVTWANGKTTPLDLTPLGQDIGPYYDTVLRETDAKRLDDQFDKWRSQVPLNTAQPIKSVRIAGRTYYIMAGVTLLNGQYQANLRAYEVTPATADEPLQFQRGAVAFVVGLPRDQERSRVRLLEAGPEAFNNAPSSIHIRGDQDPNLLAVLSKHYYILWHILTKLENIDPEALTAIHLPETGTIPGNGKLTLEVPTPPAGMEQPENPIMTLKVKLIDQQTRRLVTGDIYVNDELYAEDVEEIDIPVPGYQPDGVKVEAKAPGYKEASLTPRFKVLYHRSVEVPLNLISLDNYN